MCRFFSQRFLEVLHYKQSHTSSYPQGNVASFSTFFDSFVKLELFHEEYEKINTQCSGFIMQHVPKKRNITIVPGNCEKECGMARFEDSVGFVNNL